MGRLRRLLGLRPADRSLLFTAAVLLGSIRLALPVLPLRVLRRVLIRERRELPDPRRVRASKQRIAWAVATARRSIPGTTCLSEALATEVLLARSGHAADLRIGLTRTDGGELHAHAWVESEGQIVIGELADLSRYVRLPALRGDDQ